MSVTCLESTWIPADQLPSKLATSEVSNGDAVTIHSDPWSPGRINDSPELVNLGSFFPVSPLVMSFLVYISHCISSDCNKQSKFKSTANVVGLEVLQSFEKDLPSCSFLHKYPMKTKGF